MINPSDFGIWVVPAATVTFLAFALPPYLAARAARPTLRKDEIIYEERFASGASERNLFTRVCGANNCLRLVVTKDLLWITSWFPVTRFTALLGLEKVIALHCITSVETKRFLGVSFLLLTYVDPYGVKHAVRLAPKKREAFLQALGRSAGDLP